MRYPDLDIDLLRCFSTVAEQGGFTAAGQALGLTQSAISLKIKQEFAAKEKAKAAKPATPKPPAKAAKNSKAA